jgi:hypothetical protein
VFVFVEGDGGIYGGMVKIEEVQGNGGRRRDG